MDRSDNPGNIERQMDEAPVERETLNGGGMDRDALQGGGPVEREGMQGDGVEREGMRGGSIDRDVMEGRGNDGMMPASSADGGTSDPMMRADQREGGYGYDRPVDTPPARDMDPSDRDRMRGSSNDTDTGRPIGDQDRKTTGDGISRDW